jgi:hypothetical protein
LRGREEFGFLSPPSLRDGIRYFYGNKTSIFHRVRGKASEAKGSSDIAPDAGSGITEHVRWLTLSAAQLDGCPGVSDGLASDAG